MAQPIPIGMCINPDKVAELAPGYDYLELTVSGTLNPLEDDVTMAPSVLPLRNLQPPVQAFNVFVASSVRVTGPEVDLDRVRTYVDRAVRRAQSVGGKVIVFGSGGARNIPEGFDREKAWAQLVQFCNICADYLQGTGVTLAIEPLNHNESNVVNTYLEGVRLAKDTNRPNEVKVLADIYHFMVDSEPLDNILQAPEWLAHVHLADSGRRNPGSGSYPLQRWFDILREVDYQGMASVECRWGDDFAQESAESLAFLRPLAGW